MFRIARTSLWHHAAFAERLALEPDMLLDTFDHRGNPDLAWRALQQADVYQISSSRDELPAPFHARSDLLARCPDLLCVSAGGAGFDTVDVAACSAAGVLVLNQTGANAQSVAEAAIGLMIDITHRISLCDRRLRHDRGFVREDFMGDEITGKCLGIVGLGNVGRRLARLAAAFEMEVLAFDPLLTAEEISARGARAVGFEELLARSDVVSVHCPRDETTLGMFGASAFAAMKAGAYFINTARGGIHDERALLAALQSGQIAAAGLDVWQVEPPALDDPLLHHERVVATYHCAGVTIEARQRMAAWAADQIVVTLRGGKPPRIVNPLVWPLFEKRLARRRGVA